MESNSRSVHGIIQEMLNLVAFGGLEKPTFRARLHVAAFDIYSIIGE